MTTPTAPYAMVQAGSSEWTTLHALGWKTTDVPPGATACEGEWHHMEPPSGGSQIMVTNEEADVVDKTLWVRYGSALYTGYLGDGWSDIGAGEGWRQMAPPPDSDEPYDEGPRFLWREPVKVRPDDVLLVTAPDCPEEDFAELRDMIEKARRDPDFCVVHNFDIGVQVVRFEGDGGDDHTSALVSLWQRGPITPDALAHAIQLQHLRERMGSEQLLNRVLVAEDAAEKAGALLCHRCGVPCVDLKQLAPVGDVSPGRCEQCEHPWHDGMCTCGGWGEDEKRRAGEWHEAHPDGLTR